MYDSVQSLYHDLVALYDAFGRGLSAAIFRTILVMSIPAALLTLVFRNGNTSKVVTIVMAIVGAAIGFEIPLSFLEHLNSSVRFWLTVLAVIGLLHLPGTIAFHLVPELGTQMKLRTWIYWTELTLIALALLFS